MEGKTIEFLDLISIALDELAQEGKRDTYDEIQAMVADKGLDGMELSEIVERDLMGKIYVNN